MPPTNAFVLARCDGDGQNIYLVSHNNEPDYLPSVMNDGRVIYTRWEYTDKPLWRAQKLWTINPDGTQVSTFWGNQSVWPDVMKDARGHPRQPAGDVHRQRASQLVRRLGGDHRSGPRASTFPHGLTKVTADVPLARVRQRPGRSRRVARLPRAAATIRPTTRPIRSASSDFLVSAKRGGKFLLYLMDVDGNRELIYEGVNNIFHAMPLRPRAAAAGDCRPRGLAQPRPARAPAERRDLQRQRLPGRAGRAARQGPLPARAAHRAQDLHLLVQAAVHLDRAGGFGRAVGGRQAGAGHGAHRGRRLGGLLRAAGHGAALPTARRELPRPADHAEFRGRDAGRTPRLPGLPRIAQPHARRSAATALALRKPPRAITPPPWGDDTVSYPRYVQPVLDRYCGKCHAGRRRGAQGPRPDLPARSARLHRAVPDADRPSHAGASPTSGPTIRRRASALPT